MVIAIALLVGNFTFGNIWLLLYFALLLRTSFHRPTNLFGGLRRFVAQVFSTVELQLTVTILGSLWLLWCLLMHFIDIIAMFKLSVLRAPVEHQADAKDCTVDNQRILSFQETKHAENYDDSI